MPVTVITPIQDVYIASSYPETNFDNQNPNEGQVLFVGSFTGVGDVYRSLLQFDVVDANHGIPPNSTIIDARLKLSYYRKDSAGAVQVDVYRLLQFFNQNTVTFNTSPLSSFPTIIASTVFMSPSGTITFNLTSLVQGWYNGAIPNNGIELRGLESATDIIIGMRSTRFVDSSFWPSLEVTWAKGTLSDPVTDTLSGAPTFTTFVDMAGKEQATWLIYNPTATSVSGIVQVTQGNLLIDTNTDFTVPAGQTGIVYFTGAVNTARLKITAGPPTDTYTISVETRDE